MSEHTPGPWRYEFVEQGGYDSVSAAYCVWGPRDEDIATVDVADYAGGEWDERNAHHPVAAATARLIAAAPDLLAALEEGAAVVARYVDELGGCDHSVNLCSCSERRVLDMMRFAIARARGLDGGETT